MKTPCEKISRDGFCFVAAFETRPMLAEPTDWASFEAGWNDMPPVDDARCLHGVTPVVPINPAKEAFRDVLVVTFRAT